VSDASSDWTTGRWNGKGKEWEAEERAMVEWEEEKQMQCQLKPFTS